MENNQLAHRVFKVFFSLVAIVAIIVAGYFYNQVRILKQNPQVAAQQEANDLVAKVGNLIVLPAGETPTIATVSDPTALKDQPFFALAQKGDKVLIYAQDKAPEAILYSITLNKILAVAPLNIGPQTPVTSPTPTPTSPTTPGAKTTKKSP